MIIINNKEIRNTVEQVHKNKDDIEDLQEATVDAYTKAESDAKFATKTELASKQDTLTAGAGITIDSNDAISVDASVVPFKIDLATVATTGSYNDLSNKPNLSVYATKTEAVTKDENGNVNGILQVARLESETWDEDDDCKADIYLSSGLRGSAITLETEGEESGSSLILRGSTAVGSEGFIDLHGETRVFTNNRITVYDTNTTPETQEQVAYLSDITGGGSSFDDIVLDYSTTFAQNLPQELELTQAQFNTIKQHVENNDYNVRLIIITQGGPNVPDHTILYPNFFRTMGTGLMSSDTGFFGKYSVNIAQSSGGNMEYWGTYGIYYSSSTSKYLVGLYKFKVAYTV